MPEHRRNLPAKNACPGLGEFPVVSFTQVLGCKRRISCRSKENVMFEPHAFVVLGADGALQLLDRCMTCGIHRHDSEGISCNCTECGQPPVACGCGPSPAEAADPLKPRRSVSEMHLDLLRQRTAELRTQREEDARLISKLTQLLAAQAEELQLLRKRMLRYSGGAL